ncbi:hypothetical protein Bca4012_087124 [Brassica carinata]
MFSSTMLLPVGDVFNLICGEDEIDLGRGGYCLELKPENGFHNRKLSLLWARFVFLKRLYRLR